MLDVVWNLEESSLADLLKANIIEAQKIDMAVAFLNLRGLSLVENQLLAALDRGCNVRMFIGTDYYLTDPEALRRLEHAFRQHKKCKLFLVGRNPKAVFHPKIYVFEREEQLVAAIGSANMTGGGLRNNWEASCVVSAPLNSDFSNKLQQLFAQYEGAEGVKEATAWEIERYAANHRIFRRQIHAAEKRANEQIKSIPDLDEKMIRSHLTEYLMDKTEQADYQTRQKHYQEARSFLDQLASGNIATEAQFSAIWKRLIGASGIVKVWHSDYMYRTGHRAVQNFPEVCRMVKAIRDHRDMSPPKLFELGQQHMRRIKGIGVNVLTEMMNTYYPDRCAVLNRNPWASLRYYGRSDFPAPNSFNSHHYERFNDIVTYLKNLCGFDSMGQADHFLNFVYWKYAKRSK